MTFRALVGAGVFDGHRLHRDKAVLLRAGRFEALLPETETPADVMRTRVAPGILMPGFVDLQVNGGGGILFNDAQTVEALATIAKAHAGTGTRAILPTLITDTASKTRAALDAVDAAIAQNIPGIIGIHLEGPHLSVARKGAHDPALIRPMTDDDETVLCEAAQKLPNVMVTVAPETVPPERIRRLARAGVIVSLGHSDCTMAQALAAIDAGAVCVTHLFNAMSQLGSREPGLVGAAMSSPTVSAGLIADGVHVHPDTMRIALDAKRGPGAVFLVTDAMPTVGSDIPDFVLAGRKVLRDAGRLTLEDGTLAGADLTMPQAMSTLVRKVGVPLETALNMASGGPARLLRNDLGFGSFKQGAIWTGIHLDPDFTVTAV